MTIKFSNILVLILLVGGALSFSAQGLAEGQAANQRPRIISAQGFLESKAVSLLESGDFKGALKEINALEEQYPADPLVRRYKAMTLDLLGRFDEAIEIFEEMLEADAEHIPTHFFLGNAYARKGDLKAATEQWQWVVEHGEGSFYQTAAQAALEQGSDAPAEANSK